MYKKLYIVCQVDDMILCDCNYGLGAYGMDSVHNREPERSNQDGVVSSQLTTQLNNERGHS